MRVPKGPPPNPGDVRFFVPEPEHPADHDQEPNFEPVRYAEVPPFNDEPPTPKFNPQPPPEFQGSDQVPVFKLGELPKFNDSEPLHRGPVYSEAMQFNNGPNSHKPVKVLFHPTEVPCLGQVSYPGPAALLPGEWDLLRDIRLDGRGMRVRYGATAKIAATSNDVLYGAWCGYLNGTLTLIRAVYRSSAVVIEKADSASAPTSWSEISASSGQYGNTRFTNQNYAVSFQVVKEQDTTGSAPLNNNRELLIIQNGIASPRVYDSVSGLMATVEQLSPIAKAQCSAQATWWLYYDIKSTITNSSPSTGITHAWAANTGLVINFLTTIAAGGTAPSTPGTASIKIILSGGATSGGTILETGLTAAAGYTALTTTVKQLQMVFQCPDSAIWDRLKLEISDDDSTYVTLYDARALNNSSAPSLQYTEKVIVPLGGDYFLIAIPTAPIGNKTGTTFPLYWRFTWLDVVPTVNTALTIVAAGYGGGIQSGAQFGVGTYSGGTHTESPGTVCRTIAARLDQIGGAPTPCKGLNLPLSSLLYFAYNILFQWPIRASSSNESKPDYLFFYVKPTGGTEFLYQSATQLSTYSGSWSAASSVGTSGQTAAVLLASDVTTLRPMPDALHRCIPIGRPMANISGRLAVGDVVRSAGDAQKGDVWISADQHPFRFRPYVRYIADSLPDLRSPTRIAFQGEIVQAFAKMSGSILGADSLLIFTDAGLYSVDGNDTVQLSRPRKLGPYGTLSPRSVAEHNNQVFWLDQNRHVRSLSANMQSLSQGRVEDMLTSYNAGANLGGIHGSVFEERYYLFFSVGVSYDGYGIAQQNNLGLIYDIRRDAWTSDLYQAVDRAWALPVSAGGKPYMHGFKSNGALYRIEDPNAVGASTGELIRWQMRTRVLAENLWMPVNVGRIGMVMEAFGEDIEISRYNFEEVSEVTNSVIDMSSVTNDLCWRWDGDSSTKAPKAMSGLGVYALIGYNGGSSTLGGGLKILSVVAEVDSAQGSGPDV